MADIAEPKTLFRTETKTLREHVTDSLDNYLRSLGSNDPVDLYRIVIEEMDAGVLDAVMRKTAGNQSQAAILLGISRGTLRKKLKQYFGTTHIGTDKESA